MIDYQYEKNKYCAISFLSSFLSRDLFVIDIGARWGVDSHFSQLLKNAKIICFEPDREEYSRLNKVGTDRVVYIPLALGASNGHVDFYVTKDQACSSCFAPIPDLYNHYPALDVMTVQKKINIKSSTLDSFMGSRSEKYVDAIKLDTQGSELNIFKGGVNTLKNTTFIDLEVMFNYLYFDQPLFSDIDMYLRSNDFILWRISELCHYPKTIVPGMKTAIRNVCDPPGTARESVLNDGQLFWAQVQYIKSKYVQSKENLSSNDQPLAASIISGVYDYWDLALNILSRIPSMNVKVEYVKSLLTKGFTETEKGIGISSTKSTFADESQLFEELSKLKSERDIIRANLESVLHSRSWKLTAPFRWLQKRLRNTGK